MSSLTPSFAANQPENAQSRGTTFRARALRALKQGTSQAGASTTEYAILLMVIAGLAIGAMVLLGDKVADLFTNIDSSVAAGNDTGGEDPEDPQDPPPQVFSVALKINNTSATFLAVGPGQQAAVSWLATKATDIYQYRYTEGTCANSGAFEEPDGTASGSETLPWDADLAGCVTEICYGATNIDVPDDYLDVCAYVAYTDFEPVGNPIAAVTVNGGATAFIPIGGTANFTWSNPYPVDADISFSSDGGCPSDYPDPYSIHSGTFAVASNTPTQACTYKICAYGRKSNSFEDARNVCAVAVFAAADLVPDPLNWSASFGNAINTPQSSNTLTISGIDAPITLNLSAGSTALVNGVSRSGVLTLNNGDTVQLQTTSPASATASKTVTLNRVPFAGLPSFSSSWIVANSSADLTPTFGNFNSVTGTLTNVNVFSNAVTPTAYTSMPFTVTGGFAYLGSSTTGVTSGAIALGTSMRLVTSSAPTANTPKLVTVNYGPGLSLSKTWSVTTAISPDTTPDPVGFDTDYENSTGGDLVTEPEVLSGFDGTVTLNSMASICVNSAPCTSGPLNVSAGDVVRLSANLGTVNTCSQLTFNYGSAIGTWQACPIEIQGEDFTPGGWCQPTNVHLVSIGGTDYGYQYFGSAPAGTWRFVVRSQDDKSTSWNFNYGIANWAIYCQGGSTWESVPVVSVSIGAGSQAYDLFMQSVSNAKQTSANYEGAERLCANLHVERSEMAQCAEDHR